jgi:hypothetical protein
MAHFAELDENNTVRQVIVVHNNELLDENGNESEQKGIDFCIAHYGGTWVQTSYNNNFRQRYAGINSVFVADENFFTEPQPYLSWVRNGSTWEPPVPYPTDGKNYYWNEAVLNWIEVPTE